MYEYLEIIFHFRRTSRGSSQFAQRLPAISMLRHGQDPMRTIRSTQRTHDRSAQGQGMHSLTYLYQMIQMIFDRNYILSIDYRFKLVGRILTPSRSEPVTSADLWSFGHTGGAGTLSLVLQFAWTSRRSMRQRCSGIAIMIVPGTGI